MTSTHTAHASGNGPGNSSTDPADNAIAKANHAKVEPASRRSSDDWTSTDTYAKDGELGAKLGGNVIGGGVVMDGCCRLVERKGHLVKEHREHREFGEGIRRSSRG